MNAMRVGVAVATAVALLATALHGPVANAASDSGASAAECPAELQCRFDAAGVDHYAKANRGRSGPQVRYIVVHTSEMTHAETLEAFQGLGNTASSHYLLSSHSGAVTQLVPTKDVAFHAGNSWFDERSMAIEHEGFVAEGAVWYTEEMYRASARLVRYLAERYDIPLDREHVIGHDEVPPLTGEGIFEAAIDPGPYWDWAKYFDLLKAPLREPAPGPAPSALPRVPVVLIAPRYDENWVPLYDCKTESCTEPQVHGTNAVYLHTAPRADAPLVGDPVLHPEGQPGQPALQDWSARAVTGQRFAVAGRYDGWTGVWFVGRLAWFYDADNRRAVPSSGVVVTPRRPGIPVYSAAYPEPAAYPAGVVPTPIAALPYRLELGQFYVATAEHVADDFAAPRESPQARVHVVGKRRLVEISFSSRRAFLDAEDVSILR
ncbi:MAG: N-acetylmuramoyl-L-alanine amidase [Sporichthyaceae bacterium]